MDASRMKKLMSLGADPPNDLAYMIEDLLGELRRRGVREDILEGVEITLKIAFRLGEKNAALLMADEAIAGEKAG